MPSQFVIDCEESVRKFLLGLDPKRYKQVAARIFALHDNPRPHDSENVTGFPGHYRIDQGEYRIVYRIYYEQRLIVIRRAGKRNDDEVYKGL